MQQLRRLVAAPYLAPILLDAGSEVYFASPLAQSTQDKECGLAATENYEPSLSSPGLAAVEVILSHAPGNRDSFTVRYCVWSNNSVHHRITAVFVKTVVCAAAMRIGWQEADRAA